MDLVLTALCSNDRQVRRTRMWQGIKWRTAIPHTNGVLTVGRGSSPSRVPQSTSITIRAGVMQRRISTPTPR